MFIVAVRQSNSSMDSIDAIPFANDNAGTIKQRAMGGSQYHQNYNSSSSSSSSSLATTVNAQGTCMVGPAANSTALADDIIESAAVACDGSTSGATSRNATIDSNVLNDIGNMLANLTDELDAMLEEEKRAGINDSE